MTIFGSLERERKPCGYKTFTDKKRTHSIESNHVILIKIPLKKEKTLYLQITHGYETFLQEF